MKKNLKYRILTSLILIFILFICFTLNKYIWATFSAILAFICYLEFKNLFNKIYHFDKIAKIISKTFIIIYLFFFVFSSFHLYDQYLLFLIIICILSDTGGYVVGKTFKGKKLTKISPNKTISGSIGSIFFSLFPLIYFNFIDSTFISNNNLFHDYSNAFIVILCIVSSLFCQIGDLIISYLKRKAKIKDTGKILPGHGGILDRVDGMLFLIPLFYIYQFIT